MSSKPQTAWISGDSRGIGRALAELLKENGWEVYGCSRSAGCDICSPEDLETNLAAVPSLDLVVHAAAILGPRKALSEVSPEEMEEVLRVNVLGAFNVANACTPKLKEGGALVLLSSSVGREGRGGWGPYAMSKHALEGMADTLRDEYPNLRVLSVNPGGTATDMRAEAFPDEDPQTLPSANDVAATILKMVEDSSILSGAKLNSRDYL